MSVYPSNVVYYIVYHVSFLPPVACVARASTLHKHVQQHGSAGISVRNESKKIKADLVKSWLEDSICFMYVFGALTSNCLCMLYQ